VKNVYIETSRLNLRDLPPRMANSAARFHRDNLDFHGPWEPKRPARYFTAAEQRRILRWERKSDQMLHLWMTLRDAGAEDTIVGTITLSSIIRGYLQSCFVGYKLDRRFTGRGLMREGLAAVISHAFNRMQLHRLEANVMPGNERSLRLLHALGFTEEGTARSYLKIRDQWEDHVHMVLLSEDWKRGLDG